MNKQKNKNHESNISAKFPDDKVLLCYEVPARFYLYSTEINYTAQRVMRMVNALINEGRRNEKIADLLVASNELAEKSVEFIDWSHETIKELLASRAAIEGAELRNRMKSREMYIESLEMESKKLFEAVKSLVERLKKYEQNQSNNA